MHGSGTRSTCYSWRKIITLGSVDQWTSNEHVWWGHEGERLTNKVGNEGQKVPSWNSKLWGKQQEETFMRFKIWRSWPVVLIMILLLSAVRTRVSAISKDCVCDISGDLVRLLVLMSGQYLEEISRFSSQNVSGGSRVWLWLILHSLLMKSNHFRWGC